MKIDLSKKENGLPDISEPMGKRSTFILLLIAIVCILITGFFFHSKPKQKMEKPVEETYVPEQVVPVKNPLVSDNPVKQLTPEMVQAEALILEERKKRVRSTIGGSIDVG